MGLSASFRGWHADDRVCALQGPKQTTPQVPAQAAWQKRFDEFSSRFIFGNDPRTDSLCCTGLALSPMALTGWRPVLGLWSQGHNDMEKYSMTCWPKPSEAH